MTITATTATTIALPARARIFGAMIKREFLEHKTAFFTVPLVVGGLIVAMIAIALVTAEIKGDQLRIDGIGANEFSFGMFEEELVEEGVDRDKVMDGISRVIMTLPGTPLLLILPFIVIFPLLGALYEERRDRSYLFWKSMPVSDTEEVLAKLFGIGVVGPMTIIGFMAVAGLAVMFIVTPFIWAHGGSALELVWHPLTFISTFVGLAANYLVYFLWVFPLLAWILLASAYAPKAPLMYAVLPPLVIGLLELNFLGESWLGTALRHRVGESYGRLMVAQIESRGGMRDNFEINNLEFGDAIAILGQSLVSIEFWVGTAVGVGFLAGAVWLRRYKI